MEEKREFLERLRKKKSDLKSGGYSEKIYKAFKKKYRDDPAGFVRDCIIWEAGEGPAFYQEEILDDLVKYKRICVRGPHGLGKTTLEAWICIWFALTRDGEDWKAVSTASAWRQLIKYLWPEIHKWTRKLDWAIIGRPPFGKDELLLEKITLDTGYAFPVASSHKEHIEGAHANQMLYMFDESKTIPADIWDAAEGAFSGDGARPGMDAYAIACSTPGGPSGRFYEINSKSPGLEDWHVRHVTLEDTIKAGRNTQKWADARKRQWGEKAAVYQNRVLGQFSNSDSDGVIPLSWIEAANERWHTRNEDAIIIDTLTAVGIDVGGGGDDDGATGDKTVEAFRYGNVIERLSKTSGQDTMRTAERAKIALAGSRGRAIVDGIGIGAGVVSRLRQLKIPVVPFIASKKSIKLDMTGEFGFANLRAEAWWNAREMLDPANEHDVALPPDDELTGDLTAPGWRPVSGAKIIIDSKDDIRKRIGRSTDCGDAVVQALWYSGTNYGKGYVAGTSRRAARERRR